MKSIIESCRAHSDGCGAYRSCLKHCIIKENGSTYTDPAGCAQCYLSDCTLLSNTGSYGSGITGSYAERCLLKDNKAYANGAAAHSTMINCILWNNMASGEAFPGAAYESELWNCTVYGHADAATLPAGYDLFGPRNCEVYNSIVWIDTASDQLIGCITTNVCSPSAMHEVSGNTTNNPAFADADAGDFSLLSSSPCIDTGSNELFYAGCYENDFDYADHTRIINARIDIGAVEYTGTLQHVIHTEIQGAGTISPNHDVVVRDGANVTFAFQPAPYSAVGDVLRNGISEGSITSLTWTNITGDGTLCVEFVPIATTHRGIPEFWLAEYGWTTNMAAALEADSDGDGLSNWQEYTAGTDPTDAASFPCMDASEADDALILHWNFSADGCTYRIQHTDDLSCGFTNTLAVITNSNLRCWTGNVQQATSGYFRVQVDRDSSE